MDLQIELLYSLSEFEAHFSLFFQGVLLAHSYSLLLLNNSFHYVLILIIRGILWLRWVILMLHYIIIRVLVPFLLLIMLRRLNLGLQNDFIGIVRILNTRRFLLMIG